MASNPLADGSLFGSLFADRYHVIGCIGSGGMGAVFEAVHAETDQRCALKVMLPDMLHHEAMRERFLLEAGITSAIDSDFIVRVLEAGIDQKTGMPFIAMELLRGESLRQRLDRVGRLDPVDVVAYLRQAALALDTTHAISIVHRDLKPENIFLDERDDGSTRIKVLDFGIAKVIAEGATSVLATVGVGTPYYMAPEQLQSVAKVSPATDIYALAMIAFTLLTGDAYYRDDNKSGGMIALASAISSGPTESASARALRREVTLPPAFDAWFSKATARAPADRFRTASLAVRALSEALGVPHPAGERDASVAMEPRAAPDPDALGAPAPAPAPAPALAAPARRVGRGALWIAALVVCAACLATGILLLSGGMPSP